MSRIYIASSWRNGFQQQLVQELRKRGHKVYDFRHPYGRNDAPVWESVSITQNLRSAYKEKCLNGKDFKRMLLDRLSVERFNEHFSAMQDADTCILLLPAGRSSHIEAGHMNGMGKRVFVMDTSKEVTPELMYLALDDYFSDFEELYKAVDKPIPGVCCVCGCTMENPCYHPEHGNCWWDDSSHTICSHCAETLIDGKKVFPSIKDDPETEHCINDHSKAFK